MLYTATTPPKQSRYVEIFPEYFFFGGGGKRIFYNKSSLLKIPAFPFVNLRDSVLFLLPLPDSNTELQELMLPVLKYLISPLILSYSCYDLFSCYFYIPDSDL